MTKFSRRKNPFEIGKMSEDGRKVVARYRTVDAIPGGEENQSTLKEPIDKRRLLFLSFICFFGLIILLIRLVSIQSNASSYKEKAENNRIRIITQSAPRGIITDRNGIVLTKNIPDVGVFITPDDLPEDVGKLSTIANILAQNTETPNEKLLDQLQKMQEKKSLEPIILIEHISHDQAISLSVQINQLPGVHIAPKILREYTQKEPMSHLLGYTGKLSDQDWELLKNDGVYSLNDLIGKTGIEFQYENVLKGTNGKQRVEVDALGHITTVVATEEPQPGENITLTIDQELQSRLYAAIEQSATSLKSKGGAAVALNPQNGEVLALVSWPSFDNNVFSRGISAETYAALVNDQRKLLFNRSISGEYPSGSTIKPLIAAAALQEGLVNSQTSVMSTGGIGIDKWFFPDWKSGGHGATNVRKALSESVNTFFYAVGGGYQSIEGLGVDRIRQYAEMFGLNKPLGIDLPHEAAGFIPTKEWKENTKGEAWYIGDTYHLAIGQGDLLVTPLQVASYIATIANGGTVYTPHVVLKKGDQLEPAKTARENVIDDSKLSIVRQGMRDAVLSGSARSLLSVPFSVAAKTGTAQYGNEGKQHAWIATYAPYENPQIALVVLVEGGGEGSSTAAPIAREILTWWSQNRYSAQ